MNRILVLMLFSWVILGSCVSAARGLSLQGTGGGLTYPNLTLIRYFNVTPHSGVTLEGYWNSSQQSVNFTVKLYGGTSPDCGLDTNQVLQGESDAAPPVPGSVQNMSYFTFIYPSASQLQAGLSGTVGYVCLYVNDSEGTTKNSTPLMIDLSLIPRSSTTSASTTSASTTSTTTAPTTITSISTTPSSTTILNRSTISSTASTSILAAATSTQSTIYNTTTIPVQGEGCGSCKRAGSRPLTVGTPNTTTLTTTVAAPNEPGEGGTSTPTTSIIAIRSSTTQVPFAGRLMKVRSWIGALLERLRSIRLF